MMLIDTSQVKDGPIDRDVEAYKSERLWIIAIGAIVIVQLWFGLINTSLWVDEAGTWWIVKDGPAQLASRAWSWSGISPLYFWVAWLSTRLFGLNEVALRLPSVLAMSGALIFLYRIAARVYDRASAAIVTLVFLCVASFYAIDARPYALGLMFLTCSTWALLRWVDTRRSIYALVYTGAAALVVYTHCLMAFGLAPAAIFALVALPRHPRALAWLGAYWAAIGLLCVPLLWQLKTFYVTRSSHTVSGVPRPIEIADAFIPATFAGLLVLVAWVYKTYRGHANLKDKWTGQSMALIASWYLFTPLFIIVLLIFTDLHLFVPRYYSSALPGQALALGGLVASIRPGTFRKSLLAVFATAVILIQGSPAHGYENWRGAMRDLRNEAGSSSPVLLTSGFAEATDFEALSKPALREILFAPQLLYGEPGNSIHLPLSFPRGDHDGLEGLARQLEHSHQFFLVTNKTDRSYESWLLGRMGGCRADPLRDLTGIFVTRFVCGGRR